MSAVELRRFSLHIELGERPLKRLLWVPVAEWEMPPEAREAVCQVLW